jgi:hypothetical protein
MNNHPLEDIARSLQSAGEALVQAALLLRQEKAPPSKTNANGNGNANVGLRTDLLTGRQLGAIHAMARRAGLSRDQLGELVVEVTGKGDLARLSRTEASDVIDRLNSKVG